MGRFNHNLLHAKSRMLSSEQTKNIKSDGLDVEFSEEMADHDDLVAQSRARQADLRAKERQNQQK